MSRKKSILKGSLEAYLREQAKSYAIEKVKEAREKKKREKQAKQAKQARYGA